MRIAVISDTECSGGAGIAANNFCEEWKRSSHNVVRLVGKNESLISNQLTIPFFDNRVLNLLTSISAFSPISFKSIISKIRENSQIKQLIHTVGSFRPDIINIHNLHSASLPISIVKNSLQYAPVVWTLHDMWSFCGKPYNEYYPQSDAAQKTEIDSFWNDQAENKFSLNAVSPSKWLAQESNQSGKYWDANQISVIKNGLSLDLYTNKNKEKARATLGIKSKYSHFILLSSANLDEERKGVQFAIPALKKLQPWNFGLVLMGHNGESIQNEFPQEEILDLGFIQDERLKSIVYSAVDILLHPAPIDNLPNTIAESMASGTPVIAFNRCGMREMVVPNQNGWLSPEMNSESLSATIIKAVENINSNSEYSDNCRNFAEENYDIRNQSKLYIELFKKLSVFNH